MKSTTSTACRDDHRHICHHGHYAWRRRGLDFTTAMVDADQCQVSAGSWIEIAAVMTRRNADLNDALQDLVEQSDLQIMPTDVQQARIGHDAYRRYGRGSGHPADLNFGDCFAYALSHATGAPLLFKGDDFIHTDVAIAA